MNLNTQTSHQYQTVSVAMIDAVAAIVGEQQLQQAIGTPLPETNSSGIVLIGGGGGSATVARALYAIGRKQFAMLAPTGKGLKYRRWPSTVNPEEKDDDLTYWTDVVRMCLHGVPSDSRTQLHELLDKKCKKCVFNGSALLQELSHLGNARAIAVLNTLLGNKYEVALTSEGKTHLQYIVAGNVLNFQQYIGREEAATADHIFLSPEVFLSERARQLLEEARTIIIGPGDLTLTTQFHFLVSGFREALARNRHDPKIVLIVNLSARDVDISDYTVRHFLDHVARWLPAHKVWAVVNNFDFNGCIKDDLLGQSRTYRQFQITRAPLLGTGYTDDQQPKHDSVRLGQLLNNLLFTNSLTYFI